MPFEIPFGTTNFSSVCFCWAGDCYLKEWSEWSLCQLTCVNGEDLGFGGIQVRSRAVIIQDLENQHLCPEQALETRQCNGEYRN